MGKGADSEPADGSSLGVDGASSVVGAVNDMTNGGGDDDSGDEGGDVFGGYQALGVGDGDDDEDDGAPIEDEREGAGGGGVAAAAAADVEAKGEPSFALDYAGLADQVLSGIERDYARTVSGQLSFSERALVGGAALASGDPAGGVGGGGAGDGGSLVAATDAAVGAHDGGAPSNATAERAVHSAADDGARGGHREGADHVHEYDVELKVAIAYAAEEFGGEAPHPLLLPKAVDERRGDPRRNPAPCDPVGVAQHKLAARPPDKEPHRCKKSAHQPDTLDRVLR